MMFGSATCGYCGYLYFMFSLARAIFSPFFNCTVLILDIILALSYENTSFAPTMV